MAALLSPRRPETCSEACLNEKSEFYQMKERLAGRLERLLWAEPPSQRQARMWEITDPLERSGYLIGSPRTSSPRVFAQDLFLENPGTAGLVERALQDHLDPEKSDEAVSMVLGLLPSDGHLD